ncbi:hypothetical protein [Roseovarius autotrophicus]|uniref:hypothetical protein n=1 Tax=Roseovarius autotrophicus TaxID=2824121 RepID=UPI001B379C33|nr:hypothetical protein [Roseovarius autotrophicus]
MYEPDVLQGSGYKFEPRKDLQDKHNYTRHVFIEPDGSVHEVVRLNVLDDRAREDIIGFHFCQQYAQIYYADSDEQPQFYVVRRDDPWDMHYVLHDGNTFNLEICRIADRALLKAIKAENDCMILLRKSVLRGFEVNKIEKHFPGTIPKDIADAVKMERGKRRHYHIGAEDMGPKMFLRPPMNPRIDLKEALVSAIQKKTSKKHRAKDETVLVLDNLTTHASPDDFFDALEAVKVEIDMTPFPSIWLYTGYYSDDDGRNCEFSIIPLKGKRDADPLLPFLT